MTRNPRFIPPIPRSLLSIATILLFTGCTEFETVCIMDAQQNIVGGRTPVPRDLQMINSTIRIELSGVVDGFEAEQICSGVAVSKNHVLTAGHCFKESIDWELRLFIPNTSLSVDASCNISEVEVQGILLKKHDSLDLALIETAAPLPDWVSIKETFPSAGAKATVAGYGLDAAKQWGILRFLDTVIVSTSETEIVVDSKNAGACGGDSGGPLFVREEETGEIQLLGILSKGSIQCRGQDIFTNIVPLASWI